MPYRREHNCTIDEEVTEEIVVVAKETPIGVLKFVRGMYADGRTGIRAIRIPAHIPVSEGMRICNIAGGQFSPATPLNPRKQLLFEKPCVGVMYSLVKDFEMPFTDLKLAEIPLPSRDGCFMMGHKDLPYKNPDGTINRDYVRLSLSRLNHIDAPAELKLIALRKLLRISRGYGIKVDEQPHFKLEDLDFYLTILSEVEGVEDKDADTDSQ